MRSHSDADMLETRPTGNYPNNSSLNRVKKGYIALAHVLRNDKAGLPHGQRDNVGGRVPNDQRRQHGGHHFMQG